MELLLTRMGRVEISKSILVGGGGGLYTSLMKNNRNLII